MLFPANLLASKLLKKKQKAKLGGTNDLNVVNERKSIYGSRRPRRQFSHETFRGAANFSIIISRSMHKLICVATLSVLDMAVSRAKMAEPIEISIGV